MQNEEQDIDDLLTEMNAGQNQAEKKEANQMSIIKQAENIINHLELDNKKTIFSSAEKNLIVNYAFKLNDIDKTRKLAKNIYHQKNSGNFIDVIKMEVAAQAQIDAIDSILETSIELPKPEIREEQGIILVSVEHWDEYRYFKFDNTSLEEIKEQLRHTDRPMVDLTGERISPLDHAWLEQSDKVSLSLSVDMNNKTIRVYETNRIPEGDRTSDNTSAHVHSLSEYLDTSKEQDRKTSVLQKLESHKQQIASKDENQKQKQKEEPNKEKVKNKTEMQL